MDATVLATPHQVSCDVGDETVVLSLKDGIYYGLNPVAAFVWRLVQEETSVSAIRDRMMQEYDVEPDICTNDLHALLDQLTTWRLIEIRNGKHDKYPQFRGGRVEDRS